MRVAALVIALGVLGAAAPLQAQEAPDLRTQIFERLRAKDYGGAIELLREVERQKPSPAVLFNIAKAYLDWGGHCVEGTQAFDTFFEACAARCPELELARARAEALAKQCQPSLRIASRPAGAAVSIDGTHVGVTPLTLAPATGRHEVALSLPGHQAHSEQVELAPGATRQIDVALETLAPPAPNPEPEPELQPQPAPPTPPVARAPGPWTWATVGVAAAAAGTGIAFGVLWKEAADDGEALEQRAEQDPSGSYRDAIREHRRDARRNAIVTYSAAAGCALALIAGYFVWDYETRPPVDVAVTADDTGGALVLRARF